MLAQREGGVGDLGAVPATDDDAVGAPPEYCSLTSKRMC